MAVLKGMIKGAYDYSYEVISEFSQDYLKRYLNDVLSPSEASQVYDAIYNTLDNEGRELFFELYEVGKDFSNGLISTGYSVPLMPCVDVTDDGKVLVKGVYVGVTVPERIITPDFVKNFKATIKSSKLAKLKRPNKYGVSVIKVSTGKDYPNHGMLRNRAEFNLLVEI